MMTKTKYGIEYNLFAFETDKGIWTLVGTEKNFDTFKKIAKPLDQPLDQEFRTWERTTVFEWLNQGLIKPVLEATHIMWFRSDFDGLQSNEINKTTRNTKRV